MNDDPELCLRRAVKQLVTEVNTAEDAVSVGKRLSRNKLKILELIVAIVSHRCANAQKKFVDDLELIGMAGERRKKHSI